MCRLVFEKKILNINNKNLNLKISENFHLFEILLWDGNSIVKIDFYERKNYRENLRNN